MEQFRQPNPETPDERIKKDTELVKRMLATNPPNERLFKTEIFDKYKKTFRTNLQE